MKHLLSLTLLAVSLSALLLPVAAQAHTYDVLTADVPFKFNIGSRAFRPGHYQFILVGPGLLALRDAHAHVVASLVTRSVETGKPSPESKLVFEKRNKRSHLAGIHIANRSQVLEVLGEELAVRHASPSFAPLPVGVESLLERRPAVGLTH